MCSRFVGTGFNDRKDFCLFGFGGFPCTICCSSWVCSGIEIENSIRLKKCVAKGAGNLPKRIWRLPFPFPVRPQCLTTLGMSRNPNWEKHTPKEMRNWRRWLFAAQDFVAVVFLLSLGFPFMFFFHLKGFQALKLTTTYGQRNVQPFRLHDESIGWILLKYWSTGRGSCSLRSSESFQCYGYRS